jgi:TolA-binding protein
MALVLAGACAAGIARADSVTIRSGQGVLELPDVQIRGISDGKLLFRTASGNDSDREFAQIARIRIDAAPVMNQAEDAFVSQQWDSATDLYQKALASATTDWLKAWAGQRLVIAGQKSNRFDAAAEGYIALLQADPSSAKGLHLTMPDSHSTYLASALQSVKQALASPDLNDAQRQGLMSFQLDLQRASGDESAASATMTRMLQSGGLTASDPAAAAQLARLKLQQAAMQLDRGDFAGATSTIRSSSAIFTEPRDQAEALYYLAEVQSGVSSIQKTPQAMEDAAIAYMRVVAHFKDAPGAPFVALSLIKTAQIEQKLHHPNAAKELYEQVIQKYPNDPSVATARAGLQQLKTTK